MGFRSLKSGIVYCVFCLCCILFCSTYIMLCIYRIHESYNTWSTYRGKKENWRELLATLPPGLLCSKYIDGADVHTRKYFPQQVAHQWAVAETVTSPKFQASGNIWKPYWRCPSLIIFKIRVATTNQVWTWSSHPKMVRSPWFTRKWGKKPWQKGEIQMGLNVFHHVHPKTGWWFQIFLYFHHYLVKWSNWTHIFQRGWNHQLE